MASSVIKILKSLVAKVETCGSLVQSFRSGAILVDVEGVVWLADSISSSNGIRSTYRVVGTGRRDLGGEEFRKSVMKRYQAELDTAEEVLRELE